MGFPNRPANRRRVDCEDAKGRTLVLARLLAGRDSHRPPEERRPDRRQRCIRGAPPARESRCGERPAHAAAARANRPRAKFITLIASQWLGAPKRTWIV